MTVVEIRSRLRPLENAQLEEHLRELGYEPRSGRAIEFKSATGVVILLWVAEHLSAEAANTLVQSVAAWAAGTWRGFRRRKRGTVVLIYGPNDEVLAEVEVPSRLDRS